MSALLQPNPDDFFDPMAGSMLVKYSPSIARAAYGDDFVRSHPPMGLSDAVSAIWTRSGVAGRRPDISAMLTNSDFHQVLSDTVSTAALASYVVNYPPIMRISRETGDIVNFQEMKKVQGGIFPLLLASGEGGEVKYGSIGERGESYAAMIYSRMVEFTVEALKNDNLGLLVGPSLRIGEAVLDTKASILAGLIASNPVLSDGVAVFHAGHGNLAATGGALDVTTLSAARLAMRRQKDVDGVRGVGVEPVFLVVPPELETVGEQLIAAITAATVGEVNPFTGKLTLVVEHRLTDPKAWYLFAWPEREMSLEHGSVDGMDDPEVRTESPIAKHSVITRVAIAFGAGWVDFRGAYKNAGPA